MELEDVDYASLKAARAKYLQLGVEIEALTPIRKDVTLNEISDLLHTHSKLGIFLEEALGDDYFGRKIWRCEL